MANIRADRKITSDRVNTYRRDYDKIAGLFLIKSALLASQERLDPNLSVKALNGDVGGKNNKDSEKRTSGSGVKESLPELRYAPGGKRGPKDVLKLHASTRDMLNGDEPNFGWVPAPTRMSKEESRKKMQELLSWRAKRPKVRARSFRADPRTGERIEASGIELDVKGIGKRIDRMVPGGNLASRAAGAIGVITDGNGRFRCPPGTPAANQFTDEFGTNCFKPPISARRMVGRMRDWFNRYVEIGERMDMLDRMGLDGNNINNIPQRNLDAMISASGMAAPRERLQEVQAKTEAAVKSLQQRLGVTSTSDDNADMWEALARLSQGEWQDLDFSELLDSEFSYANYAADMTANPGATQGIAKKHTDSVRDTYIQMFDNWNSNGPMAQRYRDGDPEAVELVDEIVERHLAAERGFLKSILQEYEEHPEMMRTVKNLGKVQPRDGESTEDFWKADGECSPAGFHPVDGFALRVDFNAAAIALRPVLADGLASYTDDGRILLFDMDPNDVRRSFTTEAEHWSEIGNLMHNTIDLERWRNAYASDLSTARHGSIEAKGQHVGRHELGHVRQYQFIKNAVLDSHNARGATYYADLNTGDLVRLDKSPDQWTNEEWVNVVANQVKQILPQEALAGGFPPVGLEGFEGGMLHILSGRYYQDEVENLLATRVKAPDGVRGQEAIMLLEGMTELRALRDMGVLMSPEIDKMVAWMDNVDPRAPGRPDPHAVVWPPSSTPSAPQSRQTLPIQKGGNWGDLPEAAPEWWDQIWDEFPEATPELAEPDNVAEKIEQINRRISDRSRSLPDRELDQFRPSDTRQNPRNADEVVESLDVIRNDPNRDPNLRPADVLEDQTLKKYRYMDDHLLVEDVAAVGQAPEGDLRDAKVGDVVEFKGIQTFDRRVSVDDADKDYDTAPGQKKVNVLLPKGTKGAEVKKQDGSDAVEVPGGRYSVRSVNPDGTVTLEPKEQDSASSFAERILDTIESVNEDVQTFRKIAESYRDTKARIRRATHSDDPATARRMQRYNTDAAQTIRRTNSTPFKVTDQQLEKLWGRFRPGEKPPFTVAQAEEVRERAVTALEDFRRVREMVGSRGRVFEASEDVRDFIRSGNMDELRARIDRAVMEYHNGFDTRPRVISDLETVEGIWTPGQPLDQRGMLPARSNTYWDPFEDAYDVANGFSHEGDDARPLLGTLLHAEEDNRITEYLKQVTGFPAIRDNEFFDRVAESPVGKLIAGDVELVLRADVARRTGYGMSDARGRVALGVLVHDDDPAKVRSAMLTRRFGAEGLDEFGTLQAAHDFLDADLTGDFSRIGGMPTDTASLELRGRVKPLERRITAGAQAEAFIAGGFNGEELENVRIGSAALKYDKVFLSRGEVGADSRDLRQRLGFAGLSQTEVDTVFEFAQSGRLDLASADLMRQSKAAREQADRFARLGVNATFTNKQGVNVLDGASVSLETPGIGRMEVTRNAQEAFRVRIEGEIAERADEIARSIRSGIGLRSATAYPRRDAPVTVQAPPTVDRAARLGFESLSESEAGSIAKQVREMFGEANGLQPDTPSSTITKRILDTLGADTPIGRTYDDATEPLSDFVEELTSYTTGAVGYRLPSYRIDDVRTAVRESSLTDEQKNDLYRSLDFLATQSRMANVATRLEKIRGVEGTTGGDSPRPGPPPRTPAPPPPRKPSSDPFGNDPFGSDPFGGDPLPPEAPPKFDDVMSEFNDALESLPEGMIDEINELAAASRTRTEARGQRKERESSLEQQFRSIDEARRYGPRKESKARTAEVGRAAKTAEPTVIASEHEPDPTKYRDLDELFSLADGALATADDITKPEHRAELVRLLKEDEGLQQAFALIRARREAGGRGGAITAEDYESRGGESFAGRELVQALLEARGYNRDNIRVTDEELDHMIAVGGAREIARGGEASFQRNHVEGGNFTVGTGVDGAGLYFAVESSPDEQPVNYHFEADHYARQTTTLGGEGIVTRGVVSPTASFMSVDRATRMEEEYKETVQGIVGPDSYPSDGNPMLALRREFEAAGDTEMVQTLDDLIAYSSDPAVSGGEGAANGRSIIALLMGYDGLVGRLEADNRYILLNRSAFMMSPTTRREDEWASMKRYENLLKRAEASARDFDIPLSLDPAERTEWIMAKLQEEYGDL